jgi:hypothetical protein
MRVALQLLLERNRNARFANAWLASKDRHTYFAGLGLLPAPQQQLKFLGPADKRRPV